MEKSILVLKTNMLVITSLLLLRCWNNRPISLVCLKIQTSLIATSRSRQVSKRILQQVSFVSKNSSQQFDEFFSFLLRTILHIFRSQNHLSADFPVTVRKKRERNLTNCCELCFLQTETNK